MLRLNKSRLSALIHVREKSLTIRYFIYSYAALLGELLYCNMEYHNSSMYVPNLSILPFNTYFISGITWMPDMPSSL